MAKRSRVQRRPHVQAELTQAVAPDAAARLRSAVDMLLSAAALGVVKPDPRALRRRAGTRKNRGAPGTARGHGTAPGDRDD